MYINISIATSQPVTGLREAVSIVPATACTIHYLPLASASVQSFVEISMLWLVHIIVHKLTLNFSNKGLMPENQSLYSLRTFVRVLTYFGSPGSKKFKVMFMVKIFLSIRPFLRAIYKISLDLYVKNICHAKNKSEWTD